MEMKNIYRDKTIDLMSEADVGTTVRLAGWVENIRDHGGVSFVDLRDMYGVMQVVMRDTSLLDGITKEQAISVEGKVEHRDEETYNPKIPTGTIELEAHSVDVLGKVYSQVPFEIMTSKEVREDVRLIIHIRDILLILLQEAYDSIGSVSSADILQEVLRPDIPSVIPVISEISLIAPPARIPSGQICQEVMHKPRETLSGHGCQRGHPSEIFLRQCNFQLYLSHLLPSIRLDVTALWSFFPPDPALSRRSGRFLRSDRSDQPKTAAAILASLLLFALSRL